MQNPFTFDWMVNLFSQSTTYLYRTYMMGSQVAVEAEQWRLPPLDGPTWQDATGTPLQSADEPIEQKHAEPPIPVDIPPEITDDGELPIREARDAPLIIRFEEPGGPPTQHAQEFEVVETPRKSSVSQDTAITFASLSVPPSSSPSSCGEGEAFEDGKDVLSETTPEGSHVMGRNLNNTRTDSWLQSIAEVSEPPSECPSPLESESPNASTSIPPHNLHLTPPQQLLLHFRNDRHSLVLDSPRPHLAPHIVITPPPEPCEESCHYSLTSRAQCPYHSPNFIEPQSKRSLSVSRGARRQPSSSTARPRPRRILKQTSKRSIEYWRRPQKVFSHCEFAYSTMRTMEECSMFLELATYLQRLQCRTIAFQVSRKAQWFRKRYDDAGFFQKMETPFRWSDPAEPILYQFARCPHNVVLDSFRPFLAPHIMITEPDSYDVEVSTNNLPANPQDYRWGAALTVTFEKATAVNPPPSWFASGSSASSDSWSDVGSDLSFGDVCSAPSRPETPPPATPLTIECQLDSFVGQDPELHLGGDEGREYASYLQDSAPPSAVDSRSSTLPTPCDDPMPRPESRPPARSSLWADDEDEDLPPFDDWYTSILLRTQT